MHPILSEPGRLRFYIAAWLPSALLLAVLVGLTREVSAGHAAALAIPLGLLYALVCLSSWYPSRYVPAEPANAWRLLTVHGVGAILSSSAWLAVGNIWAYVLDRLPGSHGYIADFRLQAPVFLVYGLLMYALAAAVSYLMIAFENSRNIEREAERQRMANEKERHIARDIQRRLLPPAEVNGHGYRLAARHRPAQFVGGDFYDFYRVSERHIALVMADVAGKGIGASLIMASARASLRVLAPDHGILETIQELNHRLYDELDPREFVALAFAHYDPSTRELELVNCGLPDPLIISAGKPPRQLAVPGPRLPLGLRRNVAYQTTSFSLSANERILLYTDGLPETPTASGDPLGYEMFENVVASQTTTTPLAWIDQLIDRLGEGSEPEDDMTALLLEPC